MCLAYQRLRRFDTFLAVFLNSVTNRMSYTVVMAAGGSLLPIMPCKHGNKRKQMQHSDNCILKYELCVICIVWNISYAGRSSANQSKATTSASLATLQYDVVSVHVFYLGTQCNLLSILFSYYKLIKVNRQRFENIL